MLAVGVDGCAAGWVAVAIDDQGFRAAVIAATIVEVARAIPGADGFGIDMPIGLLATGFRAADRAARSEVGPRSRSVFMTPPRPVLELDNHADATALAVRLTGAGISRQAHGLRRKIFEVDRWLPHAPAPVWEVHPELSFRTLAGEPLTTSKDSWNGASTRRHLLTRFAGVLLPDALGPAGQAQVDDVLDAAVVAWSCRRLLSGLGRSWPDPPEAGPDGPDGPDGRPIAIWA
jgi:predicted RNase H-like nuclease